MQTVDKYYNGISPNHWLPWIPQLLTCLVRQEGNYILNLLCSVGKAYPQAVYFPIRTLYLTLKMEQREKGQGADIAACGLPLVWPPLGPVRVSWLEGWPHFGRPVNLSSISPCSES